MNNNLVSLNLNSTKNSTLQKNSTVSGNIVNLNLLDVTYTQGTKSNFQADLNNLDLMEEEYTFEELMEYADKQLENMKATARVENVINNIGDIDPNDIDDIQRALSMYNSLTDEQKRSMSSEVKTKLENAIKDYNESVNKASEVIDAINNIGEIDFNSKDKIDEVLNLYNSLTDEQKSFLSLEVVEMINSLEQVSKQIEDTQSKINELENLYSEREDNNGFWHPIKESEIEERIKELEKELGVPHQPDEWEKILNDPGAALATFGVSVLEGFIDLGEGLVDGVVYSIAKPLQVFGVDDKWAEDFISYDASGNMYDAFVDASGIDPEIAYGMMHSSGNFVGEALGYMALSAIPYAGPAVCAVAGAGSAVEDSINRQLENSGTVNDWLVFGESALGALAGFGSGQAAKTFVNGINTFKTVGLSGTKEFLKAEAKNAALNTLKDKGAWIETGMVLGQDIYVSATTGEWNVGEMIADAALVYGENFVGNLAGGYANYDKTVRYKQDFNSNMDSLDDIERSKAWEDYYKQQYGVDAVEHSSGINVEGHNGIITTRVIDVNGKKIKTNLTDSELSRYGKDNLQYGVPEDIKNLKTDVDGKLVIDWDLAPDRGAVSGTRKPATIGAGSQFDRYGNPNGNFVGKMELDSNGQYQGVSYDARSLPYTEGSQSYTKYTVVKDISSESLSKAVSELPKDGELYQVIKAQVKNDGFDFVELPDGSVKLTVTEATIAPAFGHGGGGIQYEIPVRTNYLRELGFIKF